MRNLQINEVTHEKLKAIRDKRKEENSPIKTMAAIVTDMVNKAHKREVENANNA